MRSIACEMERHVARLHSSTCRSVFLDRLSTTCTGFDEWELWSGLQQRREQVRHSALLEARLLPEQHYLVVLFLLHTPALPRLPLQFWLQEPLHEQKRCC